MAIGLLVVLRIKGVLGATYELDAPVLFEQQGIAETSTTLHLLSVLTQTGLYFKYLLLWWLPNPAWMSVDMRETFASSWAVWQNWLGTIGFILYGLLAFRLLLHRGRLGLTGLALLYPWLFFVVEFSSVRVQEPLVLYRSYLWLPGMMLLFPLLLDALPNRKRTIITLTVIALSLVPLSWNRLWVFADNYRLWNDAALLLQNEHVSGAARIYYNRGNAELAARHWNEAIADYQRVKAINPDIEQVYSLTGNAYFSLGRYQEAISEFDRAIALKPDYADAYYGKGMTLKRLHSDEEALRHMKKSCELGNSTACIIIAFYNRPR
jgi:tetratricopeptide (TPR) repeat protein